ncbi:glycosyltransferase family 4 protein [Exiguobacterium sp. S90]|uniref:glycosyltransferase family 4 protein n=1 Tax=Exiguobacterium sp. S90 TaxID=1221231 RepID=UPI001BE559AF|nr:glycosyltransferase family 4 protein [Exiguobacterium sp. S90]
MKKIMQISAIDMSMYKLLGELNRTTVSKGIETIAVCSKGDYQSLIENDGVIYSPVQIDRKVSLSNIKTVFQLVQLFLKEKPDVVHVHTPIAAVLGRVAAKIARVPVTVYTAHGFYFHENMTPLVYKICFNIEKIMGKFFSDLIFTQSQEDADIAIKGNFKAKKDIVCISNGIDVNKVFNPDNINEIEKERLRQEFNIKQGDTVLTFIGRLVEEKGILDLLNAIKHLHRADLKVILIGDVIQGDRTESGLGKKLAQFKKELNNVFFVGNRSDIPLLLSISDIFCLPSYREGMPRSIIEAMAMHNAIIATDIRGSREEVIDEETGYLVPLNNPHEISSRINLLMNDKSKLVEFKVNGRKRAVQLFNEQRVIETQLHHIERKIRENAI